MKADEEKLWRSGVMVMGLNTQKSLQNAFFYMIGKMLIFVVVLKWGRQKYRRLKGAEIQTDMSTGTSFPKWTVELPKSYTSQARLFQCLHRLKLENAVWYKILDLYIQKTATRSLWEWCSADPKKPWYGGTSVGKNILENKLKKMCSLTGIEGRVTNHSLRMTSVMQIYENWCAWEGHSRTNRTQIIGCITSVRKNEYPTAWTVSKVLSSPQACTYNEQVQISIQHASFCSASLKQSCNTVCVNLPKQPPRVYN